MTQSFMPHLSESKPLPPTFFPMNNNSMTSSPFNTESVLNSTTTIDRYTNNPFSQPFTILKNQMQPVPSQSISTIDNSTTIKAPLTLHQKKLLKTNELIRAKQSNLSDSSSSSSGDEVCPQEIKPIQTVQNITITTTRKNSAVGETEQKPKRSTPPSSKTASIPILSFSNFWKAEIPSHSFTCKEGFLLNDSKKAPPDTSHNLTIRDSLHISSQAFNRCTCKLKLKDGSADGVIVSTEAFKPNNMNNVTTYECTVTIPQKITTLKGSSSSRIGYIEIYNQDDECIAVSSFFWIRSRSRLQLDKDTKRKLVVEPGAPVNNSFESQKRKREEEDNESDKKIVKTEVVDQQTVPVVNHEHVVTSNIPVNTLPPISLFCSSNEPLQYMFNEILKLKEIVSNQQKEISQLKERLGQ